MSPEGLCAGFALTAAVSWGLSDFAGGIGAKDASAAHVVLVGQSAGALGLWVCAVASGEPVPSREALMWGVGAGLGAAAGLVCFYRALAIGPMGINAPIAAILTSALAAAFGAWTEGPPGAVRLAGFALGLVAIALMTFDGAGRGRGLGLAVASGLGFAVYLLCSGQAAAEAVFWPLLLARLVAVAVVGVGLRRSRPIEIRAPAVAAGVFDALANALFVGAVQTGRLDVAVVLSAFYPGVTVLCARVVLGERVGALQAVGVGLAVAAVPLIALR